VEQHFYCVTCGQGFLPLDETLLLTPRRKQLELQKAKARLATEVPYETANELFRGLAAC